MLFRPRKDNTTLWQHCRQVFRSIGKWPAGYEPIEPPEDMRFIWEIFWEMRNHSKGGFNGPEVLSFPEIDAWERIRGFRLDNWVVDMILAMDLAYMRKWQEKSNG